MAVSPITFCLRLAALALLVDGTAAAHEGATGIVLERMKAMEDTAAQAKTIDQALKAAAPDIADIRTRAECLHAHAHDMTGMFPQGSDRGYTFAGPEIWTSRGDFERLARAYDAAEVLVEAARMPFPTYARSSRRSGANASTATRGSGHRGAGECPRPIRRRTGRGQSGRVPS